MKATPPLLGKVGHFLAGQMIGSERLVVAVSGGADSAAPLRALQALREENGAVGELVVVHLNHQLRGEESNDDEEFVRRLAEKLSSPAGGSVEFRSRRLDVAGLASAAGLNLEAAARRARYDWF